MSIPLSTPTGYRLGLNTGFAVNRFAEPEEWVRIVGEILGVRVVQLTADMLNVDLPASVISRQLQRIRSACHQYDVTVTSTFTGAYTRVNHFAHPDKDVREHWIGWFKRFVDLTVDVGAKAVGSHFGIFTSKDNSDPKRRAERRQQNIHCWHEIAQYANDKGIEYLLWEPMSISREQGETLSEARSLQDDVNVGSPLPIRMCLDVDHGDLSSRNPNDTDPYIWLRTFAKESPIIHLKQSSANKSGHWPFTEEHNKAGRIVPEKVVETLVEVGVEAVELDLELSFREREPIDSNVVKILAESVSYWREVVTQ